MLPIGGVVGDHPDDVRLNWGFACSADALPASHRRTDHLLLAPFGAQIPKIHQGSSLSSAIGRLCRVASAATRHESSNFATVMNNVNDRPAVALSSTSPYISPRTSYTTEKTQAWLNDKWRSERARWLDGGQRLARDMSYSSFSFQEQVFHR